MNPSCKLPCYMNSSNSKMLQIPLKQELPAPRCYTFHQHVANSMENERFQLQNVAKTVAMVASSSEMLQIARKTCRKNGSKTQSRNGQTIISKTILDPHIRSIEKRLTLLSTVFPCLWCRWRTAPKWIFPWLGSLLIRCSSFRGTSCISSSFQ